MEQKDLQTFAMYIHLTFLPILGYWISFFVSKKLTQREVYLEKHRASANNFSFIMIGYLIMLYVITFFSLIAFFIIGLKEKILFFLFSVIGVTLVIYLIWSVLVIRAAIRAKKGLEPPYPNMPFTKNRF